MTFEETKYVVCLSDRVIWWDTARYCRKDSISCFLKQAGEDWQYWRKHGYRCIKFKIKAAALPCIDYGNE